jgi:tetratricopeptide (TPR) repeat protein
MIPGKGLFSALTVLLAANFAQAGDWESKERAAKTACLSGDYAKGVAILSELYVSTDDPTWIFNQGRCYQQNHRYDDAIARFQEYLRVAKRGNKADKVQAQRHISECEDLIAKQRIASSGTETTTQADREAKERAARKSCLTGDAAAGVALLTDLFIDTKDPTYLFNQGRCLEQNRRYDEAIGRFREYLIKATDSPPKDRADAERHITACESYLRARHGESAKAEPDKTEANKPSPPNDRVQLVGTTPPREGGAGAGLRTAGLVVTAVGGAGVIAGFVLNLKVNSLSTDLENEYDPGKDAARRQYKTAGWIGYGAGAACLATGAVLYVLGWRTNGSGSTQVALAPVFGPELTGTVVQGSF